MIEIPPGFIEFKLDENIFRVDVLEQIQVLDNIGRNFAKVGSNDPSEYMENLLKKYHEYLENLWKQTIPFHAVCTIRNAIEYAHQSYKKKLEAIFVQHFGVPTSSNPSPTTNESLTTS